MPICLPPSRPHRPEVVLWVVGIVANSYSYLRRKGCNTEHEVLAESSCLKRRRVTLQPGQPGLWRGGAAGTVGVKNTAQAWAAASLSRKSAATSCVSGPETTPKLGDTLGRLTGPGTWSYSWLWFIPAKGHKAQSAKGKAMWSEAQKRPGSSFQSLLPGECPSNEL